MKLPVGWERDEMIREEVHVRIRGLIREGYSNQEIAHRVGCNGNTVTKQRRKMGVDKVGIIELRKERVR